MNGTVGVNINNYYQLTMPGSSSTESFFEFSSFIRGFHVYKTIWNPAIGDVLTLEKGPTNEEDKFAVAVMDSRNIIVGHIPRCIAPTVSNFLKRTVNKGSVQVTGDKVNRGAGYGLEIPCLYRLYGPEDYISKVKHIISSII